MPFDALCSTIIKIIGACIVVLLRADPPIVCPNAKSFLWPALMAIYITLERKGTRYGGSYISSKGFVTYNGTITSCSGKVSSLSHDGAAAAAAAAAANQLHKVGLRD